MGFTLQREGQRLPENHFHLNGRLYADFTRFIGNRQSEEPPAQLRLHLILRNQLIVVHGGPHQGLGV